MDAPQSRSRPTDTLPPTATLRETRDLLARTESRRRQADTALRRAAGIVASAEEAIICADLDGIIRSWNPAAERLFGWTEAEAVGQSGALLHAGDAGDRMRQVRAHIERGETMPTHEGVRRRKDGTLIPLALTICPMRDTKGAVTGAVAFARSVSDQKRTEQRLRESEERFRQMAEAIDQVFFLIAPDHSETLYLSPAYERIWGRPVSDAYARPGAWMEAIHPEDAARMRAKVAAGPPDAGGESLFRIRRPDGTVRWIRSRTFPVRDIAGRVYRIAGMAEDVTELQLATARIRDSEERFRQLAETIREVFWMCDARTWEILYISPACEGLWGRTAQELAASPAAWAESIHPDDRARVLAANGALPQTGRYDEVYRLVRPDGSERWVHDRGFPIRDAAGEVYRIAGIAEDITALKAAETALAQSEAQLRHAQKMEAVGRLAGGVAHDFNNLLTGVLGYADLVHRGLHARDPLREDVEEIRKAGWRAADLTRQLLAFGRKQMLQPRVLDPNEVVRGMEKLLRRIIGEHIELSAALAPSVGRIQADPSQVEQVILNLAVNARDAMPKGGTLAITTADADLAAGDLARDLDLCPGPYVVLTVTDTGVGMDAAVRAHLFEPFFTTKAVGKGTGLGLSTVYGIVKQSGGGVAVESAPGRGTTFRIYFPRMRATAEIWRAPPPAAAPTRGAETVLVVEDEATLRALVARVLRDAGYTVLAARHGGDALAHVERHPGPIHLVLTDVVMPQMGGPELVERLTHLRPGIRALFMSGYAEGGVGEQGALGPGVEFLAKPFPPDDLARRVREVLDAPRSAAA